MVFVKGYGQMCNNILQFAHAYAWGKENNVQVISMRFAYKYRYFTVCKRKHHRWSVYLFAKLLIKLRLIDCFLIEEPTGITPELLNKLKYEKMVAIDGWHFRFPELFLKYEEDIKKLFTFKDVVTKRVNSTYLYNGFVDIRLGVHIRRGDYITWQNGKFFFDDEVYINHIRQFLECFPGKKVAVFICTNDSKLRINHYKQALGIESLYLARGNEAEDLYLLSRCNYLIGVKSTFSLMASFYQNRPLYWIKDKEEPLSLDGFRKFKDLFMSV